MSTFKGWDWQELIEVLGIELLPHEEREVEGGTLDDDVAWTRAYGEYINWLNQGAEFFYQALKSEQEEVAKLVREFLTTLAEEEANVGYLAPLWRGMAQIENDYMLLSVSADLIGWMWV